MHSKRLTLIALTILNTSCKYIKRRWRSSSS